MTATACFMRTPFQYRYSIRRAREIISTARFSIVLIMGGGSNLLSAFPIYLPVSPAGNWVAVPQSHPEKRFWPCTGPKTLTVALLLQNEDGRWQNRVMKSLCGLIDASTLLIGPCLSACRYNVFAEPHPAVSRTLLRQSFLRPY